MSARQPLAITGNAAEEFRWPAPPYFEFVREQDRFDWANCLLIFSDGTSASGQVRSFVPEEALLTFQPKGTGETVSVAFSLLLKLQLCRPVELRRETPPAGVNESDTTLHSEGQPFRIDLANDEIFQGVTLGCVSALCGLFLYLPQANDSVVRCFLPAQAMKFCSIDAPRGQVPIDRNAVSSDAVVSVDEPALNGAMADKPDIRMVNLNSKILPDILAKISAAVAHRRRVVPLREAEGALLVAIENPLDSAALEELRAITRMEIVPVCASAQDIASSLRSHYGAAANSAIAAPSTVDRRKRSRQAPQAAEPMRRSGAGVHELISRLAAESGNQDIAEQQAVSSDSALVGLVNRIVLDAVEQNASDIHIEANLGPKTTQVRFRKDGSLVKYLELPAQFRNAVVSRIKIMSQLDITERRKPQDGKIDFSRYGPAQVELRIATVPTTDGLEDVVMRVLAAANPVPMDELDLDTGALISIQRLISKPHGLFLVCGPTGSGKTTTLHSLLAFLNTSERKIWTAEDPIEITQAGLRQVQVNSKIGWTFAVAMRSFMRADPDVIMVGEMRDAETAKIGIEASLTGHLVLSTLHTNSAPESIVRLLDLGMDPFNFADALLGVLGQRLARRLCPECRSGYTPSTTEFEQLALDYCNETAMDASKQMQNWIGHHGGAHGKITLFRAQGCEHCDHTGYQGRIGLHELLVSDSVTKRLLQSKAPVAEMKSAAVAAGMRTLRQDGIDKVLQGLTDMAQVNSVCS